MKRIFILAVAASALLSCDKDITDKSSLGANDTFDVSVRVATVKGTRASVVETEGHYDIDRTWEVKWENGNEITGLAASGNGYKFTLDSDNFDEDDKTTALFTGKAEAGSMRFVMPYKELVGGKYVIDLSSQTVDMCRDDKLPIVDYEHQAEFMNALLHYGDNNLYMLSDKLDIAGEGDYSGESPTMKHLVAGMKLNYDSGFIGISNLKLTPQKVTLIGNDIIKSADINFENGTLENLVHGDLEINIENPIVLNVNEGFLPFSVIPFYNNEFFAAQITFSNGLKYTNVYTPKNETVEAGTFNVLSNKVEALEWDLDMISADKFPDITLNISSIKKWVISSTSLRAGTAISCSPDLAGLTAALNVAGNEDNKIIFQFMRYGIPDYAFCNNDALKKLYFYYIGDKVGDYAFKDCSNLSYMKLSAAGVLLKLGKGIFDGVDTENMELLLVSIEDNGENHNWEVSELTSNIDLSIRSGKVLTVHNDDGTTDTYRFKKVTRSKIVTISAELGEGTTSGSSTENR